MSRVNAVAAMSDVAYRCIECGKVTAGRKPRGGDGCAMYPRRHKNANGTPCDGNIKEAVCVPRSGSTHGRLRDLVGRKVRLLVAKQNKHGDRYFAGDLLIVESTWRGTFTLKRSRRSDKRIGLRGVTARHVVLVKPSNAKG